MKNWNQETKQIIVKTQTSTENAKKTRNSVKKIEGKFQNWKTNTNQGKFRKNTNKSQAERTQKWIRKQITQSH